MNKVIKEINDNAEIENDYWGKVLGGNAVEVEIGELLFGLVRSSKPQVLIETGTNNGYSTLCIIEALRQNGFGYLYTFDTCNFDRIIPDTTSYNKYYQFILGDSLKEGKKLLNRINNVDFIFLDSSHETQHVINEFKLFYPILKPGGIICFHDTILVNQENWAVRYVKDRYDINIIRIFSSRGFDIGVKR